MQENEHGEKKENKMNRFNYTHLDYHNKGFGELFDNLEGGTCAGSRKSCRKTSETHTGAETQAAHTFHLTRNTDPVTSHKAAERVTFRGDHHRKIYEALKTMKDGTFYEIAEVAGMEPAAVWRRLNELEKQNRIVQTGEERRGPTGRMCRIWKVK